MLTKDDLQAIGELVKAETTPIKKDLQEVKKDGQEIKATQSEMQTTLKDHTRRLRGLKMLLSRARKDIHYVTGDYDQRIIENRREIEKIKEGLSSLLCK